MRLLLLLVAGASLALSAEDVSDTDGEQSRKILGSSVVTSVSVIMDTGNGSHAVFTDAVGKPVPKPSSASELASPIDLLNPDRYEFYTFDDNGDLIKRLMSLEEIQGIIATGDSDGYDLDSFTSLGYLPEKRVNDVVNNVQNVLKEEMETHKTPSDQKPIFDTPDVSDSWSMILPAVFGNSGGDIKPERPIAHGTPDTIMVEPAVQNGFLSTAQKNTFTTSSTFITSASTPRSTSYTQTSTKGPTVFSTSAQMSTTDKLMTLNTGSTTDKISVLIPVTESEIKPLINVEIYSNSKSTTEKPLDQLGVETVPFIEIKPNSTTDSPQINEKPTTTTKKPSTTVKTELSSQAATEAEIKVPSIITQTVTKPPATLMTFMSSSLGSTLPTTKTALNLTTEKTKAATSTLAVQMDATTSSPNVINQTTEDQISTWRPELFSVTETQTVTEELPFSTWTPNLDTTEKPPQVLSNIDRLPTLAELLNNVIETKPSDSITTTIVPTTEKDSTVADIQYKEEPTTTENTTQESKVAEKIQGTEKYIPEDLTTLSSELSATKINNFVLSEKGTQSLVSTTLLPADQSTNNDQKLSATEVLDQLLSTTNIYEINTELGEKTTEQQIFNNDDERFETNTQQESKVSEVKTELPTTTEQFLIQVTDQNEEVSADKNLIGSIEQLLSQAVGSVEEVLTAINDTQTVQNILSNSGSKNMSEVQVESATLASSLIGSNSFIENSKDNNEPTTTEVSMLDAITSAESSVLSDSLESLLSQVYGTNKPVIPASAQVQTTEKYLDSTTISKGQIEEGVLSTLASDKWEVVSIKNNEDDDMHTFLMPETTTSIYNDELSQSTKASYVQVNVVNNNSSTNVSDNKEFVPHLINITIITSDNTNSNIRNSSYKPAKSDVSLEQMLEDEFKKNLTLAESIEQHLNNNSILTSPEKFDDKTPNEILKAEETIAGIYNPDSTTTTTPPAIETTTTFAELNQQNTEFPTEESTAPTDSFIPIKNFPTIQKRPTTIVIIKRTEKPSADSYSTSIPDEDIETTTIQDEKLLESTTYSKLYTETTQFVTEESPISTTDLNQEDSITERITEKPDNTEAYVEIIITEKNQNDSKTNPSTSTQTTTLAHVNQIKQENNNIGGSNIDSKLQIQSSKKEDTIIEQIPPKSSEAVTQNKTESTWTLVPTIAPHSESQVIKNEPTPLDQFPEIVDPPEPIDLEPKPLQGFGLEDSTSRLDTDIYQFAQLCNELAFGFWKTVTNGLSSARSIFVSPFGATSLLAMVFLGARGATSGEMNEILRLDDMVTFNPHLIFKNVSESIKTDEADSGVAASAIIRELFSDRSKGKLLPFYKERARAFYDGYVEEVSFREIGDVIRRRTNLQVKKYTNGRTSEYLRDSSVSARSPLAGVSVNIFQTDCSQASTDGRDGELHFVVLPSIRQRRLIPIPAVVYRSGFLAGYEPSLDATAISLGSKEHVVSTILVIPGQQGISAPGDGLARLEKRLVESSFKKGAWSRLMRSLIPRPGLEVQIPRFSHRSIINATVALKKMGLHDLFDVEKADLRGLNGVANELFLSDMLQINSFATCGEKRIAEAHHSEIYPATAMRARSSRHLDHFESEESFWRSDLLEEPRDYQRAFHDPLHDPSFLALPLQLRPRQARIPETSRLRFDRPFLYFIRHNPTGLILHMGRFNPRLLP